MSEPTSGMSSVNTPSYDDLWAEATRDPASMIVDHPEVTVVEGREKLTFYFFTKPRHSAHPSVVKRSLVKQDDGYYMRTDSYNYDSTKRPSFDHWLKTFQIKDEKNRELFAKQLNTPQ